MVVVISASVEATVAAELQKRAGRGEQSRLVNEALKAYLFRPAADAANAEDLNKKRQTFIEDFKATSKSEEKAEGLMLAAIKDGLFSNQSEFRRALKNA